MVTCFKTSRSWKEQLEHDLLDRENEFVAKRVRFKATSNPRLKLRFNNLGTIAGVANSYNWSGTYTKLWIRWDKDDNYTLMDNFDSLDVFKEAGI